MAKLIFITHSEVVIDPDRSVTDWELSEFGKTRIRGFADTAWLTGVTAIWSSDESKAIETARCLASPKGLTVSTHPGLGENDRSSTGFLPRDQFEAAADSFFAEPKISFQGWERACDAQDRIVKTVRSIVEDHARGDLAIVSHGAVGTLLWCHLSGRKISRSHDQPSQGHYWCADLSSLEPETGWRSIG